MKVLLSSDWHNTPFAEEKFESQAGTIGERFMHEFDILFKKKSMKRMTDFINDHDIKIVVCNGDLQECMANEQGMKMQNDFEQAIIFIEDFKAKTGQPKLLLNMGNHDSGYGIETLPLATDPNGGITRSSINNFCRLLGKDKPYHSEIIDGFRFCFVPYLMTERFGRDFDIDLIKKGILDQFKSDLEKEEDVILFFHDPDALTNDEFLEVISNQRHKIKKMFCGHCHWEFGWFFNKLAINICSKWYLGLFRWIFLFVVRLAFTSEISAAVKAYYLRRANLPKIMKEFGVRIIPAPFGRLGMGGGFFVLDTKSLEVKTF